LIYTPGTYSKTSEVEALVKVAAHIMAFIQPICAMRATALHRHYRSVEYCESSNIPLEISHFKVSGQQNWGRSQ
jgi:N-acyl-D-amino-acid deacylase